MPNEWGDRQSFLPKALEYVGSFNLNSKAIDGVSTGHAALELNDEVRASASSMFFHVLRAATVSVDGRERDCPSGGIRYAHERLVVRSHDGLMDIAGQLVLHTKDHAAIDGTYTGIARFSKPLFRLTFEAGDSREGQVHINIGFDTGDQRYAWLANRQCIAFGKLNLEWVQNPEGKLELRSSSSFDIYSGS
jgi:hypothetical protein